MNKNLNNDINEYIKDTNIIIDIFNNINIYIQNSNNKNIINIISYINEKNKNIEQLINKIKNTIDMLNININENDLYKNIDNFITIYINITNINNKITNIYEKINIDYTQYDIDFTTLNKIIKIKNNIDNEYNIYIKNNNIIDKLINYFNNNIYENYKNNEELYIYISNNFLKYNEIIELYIEIFNKGIDIIPNIINIHEENKDKILNIIYKNIKNNNILKINNYVQNFRLVSKDDNITLYDLIYKITKIKSKKLQNINKISDIIQEIDIIMKNYSNINKKNISLIIYHINNNIEYNINKLIKKKKKLEKNNGINNKIIDIYKTIIINNNDNILKNNTIYTINYKENNNYTIIVETVDLQKYKLLYINNKYLIGNDIITKILRNQPSYRINSNNKYNEEKLFKYKNYTSIQNYYTKIYLDFEIDESNIANIYKKLVNIIYLTIINKIKKKKITNDELFNIIINNNEKIINIFTIKLNNFYNIVIKQLKLEKKELSEIYLVYLSYLNIIILKFSKKLTDTYIYINNNNNISNNEKKLEYIISESINSIINTRSNLYNIIVEKYHILHNYKKL